jgi:hypothetical protein
LDERKESLFTLKIALLIIGLLLLLPGICGGFFLTFSLPDIWKFVSTGHGDPYGVIVVALSASGLLAGCLGLYAIARSERFSKPLSRNLLSAGLIISLATIAVTTAYFFRSTRPGEFVEWFTLLFMLIVALAVVPLPLYWHWRKIH